MVITRADAPDAASMIVAVNKPKRQDILAQLKRCCDPEGAPGSIWTDSGEAAVMHRVALNLSHALTGSPTGHQTLNALSAGWATLDGLTAIDQPVTGRLSLKDIILDLKNPALTNARGDAFEEAFKLIRAKRYDACKRSAMAPIPFNSGRWIIRTSKRSPRPPRHVIDMAIKTLIPRWTTTSLTRRQAVADSSPMPSSGREVRR